MTFILIAVFVTVSCAMFAASMALRDLGARRRAEAAEDENNMMQLLPKVPTGRVDRAFADLVIQSGSKLDAATALAIVMGSAVVSGMLAFVIADHLLAVAIALILGASVPLVVWSVKRQRRFKAMSKSLPETLDLLADTVRSGHNLEQAAEMAATETHGPLAEEFATCASQLQLGQTPVAVLGGMVRRIPLAEFKVFAIAVAVHRQTGGNLAALTERMATSARDRAVFNGHLSAVTAASRLSAIGLILASVLGVAALSWLQPEYLERFLTYRWGPFLLGTAAVLQLIGAVWLWRVLRIKF